MMTNPTIDQATAQDAAVSAPLQSVLDTLAGTLDTTASQSAAALQLVTNTLRNSAKQAGQTNQAGINAALNAVGQAVATNSTLNEAVLNNIVSAIAGVPAAPNPAYQQSLTPATTTYIPGVNASPGPGIGYYTPAQDVYPVNQFGPQAAQPVLPPPTPPQPGPCPPGMVWDAQYSTCVPPGYQNPTGCTPPLVQVPGSNPPQCYLPPPPTPPQPPPPPPNIPPPGGPNPPPPPVMPPPVMPPPPLPPSSGCQFAPPGGTGNCNPGQLPTNLVGSPPAVGPCDYNGGYPYDCPGGAEYVAPDGSIHYVAYYFPSPAAMPTPPLPPPQPPLPPSPPPSPTCPPAPPCPASPPPPSPPPSAPACSFPPPSTTVLSNTDRIGGPNWCANINQTAAAFSAVGTAVMQVFNAAGQNTLSIPSPMTASLAYALSYVPFGIGSAIQSAYNTLSCVWNTVVSWIQYTIAESNSMINATVCGQGPLLMGLIIVRSLLHSLRNVRVGTDAGLWLTTDLQIEWEQADAAIDYLIRYACPYGIPSISECMALRRGNWISPATYECWMGMNNADPTLYGPALEQSRPRPGIEERKQFLYRMRPDNPEGLQVYSDNQFLSDISVDGTNDVWKQRQYAIRYRTYTLREIQRLFDSGQVTDDDIYNAYRDLGFADDKATTLQQMELTINRRRKEAEIEGYTPARIARLYMQRVLQPPDVVSQMNDLSFTADQATELMNVADQELQGTQQFKFTMRAENDLIQETKIGYILGTINSDGAKANLTSLGATDDVASSMISNWDATAFNDTAKASIAAIKKGWKSGYMPTNQVVGYLQSAGLISDKASSLLSQWELERSVDERVEDVSQILAAVANGSMDGGTAGARLSNMGWDSNDSGLLVGEAQQRLNKSLAEVEAKQAAAAEREAKAILTAEKQAQAAAARAAAQAAAAAEKLARQALTAQRAAREALLKATPISLLNKLLKEGNISREAYVTRMILLGYEEASAQLQADDACSGKTAACIPTAGPDDATLEGLPG